MSGSGESSNSGDLMLEELSVHGKTNADKPHFKFMRAVYFDSLRTLNSGAAATATASFCREMHKPNAAHLLSVIDPERPLFSTKADTKFVTRARRLEHKFLPIASSGLQTL